MKSPLGITLIYYTQSEEVCRSISLTLVSQLGNSMIISDVSSVTITCMHATELMLSFGITYLHRYIISPAVVLTTNVTKVVLL